MHRNSDGALLRHSNYPDGAMTSVYRLAQEYIAARTMSDGLFEGQIAIRHALVHVSEMQMPCQLRTSRHKVNIHKRARRVVRKKRSN